MITDIVNAKRKELLEFPQKPWSEIKTYESLIIVPTTHKHDSGWRLMAIIGCNTINDHHNVPQEIVGYCDDLNFLPPKDKTTEKWDIIQCDMLLSNCIRFHSNYFSFTIGGCCSSTEIQIVRIEDKYK